MAIQVRISYCIILCISNHCHQKISLFLSFPLDDSYTPAVLSIRAGTGLGDLQEVRAITLEKPDGWITFDVSTEPSEDGDGL